MPNSPMARTQAIATPAAIPREASELDHGTGRPYLKPKQRFAAYISAQGGANVPRDKQTVRTAKNFIDELNEYEEEIQKIIGIYAPYPGSCYIQETRTTQWRIVAKAVEVAVHPLNLISASGAASCQ